MFRLKKIDQLLLTSFVGPFIVTFFIALFVLVMQMLWLYIDDIAGKGVGFFLLMELVGYMSVSFIPLAFPIAVLISSVMVMGNLAERYELASIKSAGVSLVRVMMPLMAVTALIAIGSFFCSNNLIPVSNLQFKSRLYDIRKQKPTLNLEEGAFNDDFKGFSIRIGEKLADGRGIKDILIYDQTEISKGKMTIITAKSGEMYMTDDNRYFIMNLRDGMQAYEPKATGKTASTKNKPFARTYFKVWEKVFDLSEFEMNETDTGLFSSHHTMLTVGQLQVAIDSIDIEVAAKQEHLWDQSQRFFHHLLTKKEAKEKAERAERGKVANEKRKAENAKRDSLAQLAAAKGDTSKHKKPAIIKSRPPKNRTGSSTKKSKEDKKGFQSANVKKNKNKKYGRKPLVQKIDKPLTEYKSFAELFPKNKREDLYDKGRSFARSILGQSESAARNIERRTKSKVLHTFEMHSKFNMAVACILFLFIGAPMGAIVRKGGFGYPLLIAIGFFMIFMVTTIFSKNIAENNAIDAALAAWLPCIVLFPFGLFLTIKSMNDSPLFGGIKSLISKIRATIGRR